MSPEWKLLLESARPRPDAATIRSLVGSGIDWPEVVRLADRHGIDSLLAWRIGSACPAAAPPGLSGRLAASAKYNLELTAELLRLLDALQSVGIPGVPLKGPAIAWSLYDTPALRPSGDLDLLVREPDAGRAIDRLISLGYRQEIPGADLVFLRWNNELPLTRADSRIKVDLHWRLHPVHRDGFDAQTIFGRLAPVEIAGRRIMTLSPPHLLMYLCEHGAKHAWSSLSLVCDVAFLIERQPLDWDEVLRCAEDAGISRMLFLGLLLAHELFGAILPAHLHARAESAPAVGPLVRSVVDYLMSGREPGVWEGLKFRVATLERTRDKLRLCRGKLQPTSAEWQSLRLPPALFPLYYLARPLRLAWRWFGPPKWNHAR